MGSRRPKNLRRVIFALLLRRVQYLCSSLLNNGVLWRERIIRRKLRLTASTVTPLPVSIVVRCQGAPKSFAVSSCAAIILATFVFKRECAAISTCSSFSAETFRQKEKKKKRNELKSRSITRWNCTM